MLGKPTIDCREEQEGEKKRWQKRGKKRRQKREQRRGVGVGNYGGVRTLEDNGGCHFVWLINEMRWRCLPLDTTYTARNFIKQKENKQNLHIGITFIV